MTSLMKLALRSLSTSSLTALRRSSLIFIFFCDTGLACGQMGSLWQIMIGWIPGFFLCRTSAMCLCSWLVRSLLSCIHRLGLGLSCSLTSSLMGFRTLLEVSLRVYIEFVIQACLVDGQSSDLRHFIHAHNLSTFSRCGVRLGRIPSGG